MKRKYGSQGGQEDQQHSIYAAPPLESTMLLDTGGVVSQNSCIGNITSIPVNASLSSGTRLFQYNRFFWNKDLFTFNFENCGIFIIISYYDGTAANTMFYPIFLPSTAMTTFQSLSSSPLFDPAIRERYIADLLYFLNGAFTGNGIEQANVTNPPVTGPMRELPSLFAFNYKGYLSPNIDNPSFPIFQMNKPPPLKFISIGSNQNIALIKNPDYWDTYAPPNTDIAFQLVTPHTEWTASIGNPLNNIVFNNFPISTLTNGAAVPAAFRNVGNQNPKGWTGRGAFSIGFGQVKNPKLIGQYSDIYIDVTNPMLEDIWRSTNFVGIQPGVTMSLQEFAHYADNHLLQRYCVIARYMPSFLPTRFITVESDILTRDQRLVPISNNSQLASPSLMGIEYLTLDAVRTWTDATLSGILPSNYNSGAIGGRTNGNDDTPVIHMNPYYSIQSIDIEIHDEWQTNIQNFRGAQNAFVLQFDSYYTTSGTPQDLGVQFSGNYVLSYVMGENTFVLDYSGGQNANVTSFQIPAWLAAMNPLNAVSFPPPSNQPLIGHFGLYNSQWTYMLYYIPMKALGNPNAVYTTVPLDFSPNMPYSGNIIHFGRVLGY